MSETLSLASLRTRDGAAKVVAAWLSGVDLWLVPEKFGLDRDDSAEVNRAIGRFVRAYTDLVAAPRGMGSWRAAAARALQRYERGRPN
jgi:hypothetical protein